jgi:hypothetical protein
MVLNELAVQTGGMPSRPDADAQMRLLESLMQDHSLRIQCQVAVTQRLFCADSRLPWRWEEPDETSESQVPTFHSTASLLRFGEDFSRW